MSEVLSVFLKRAADKQLNIGIVGLGYVGLPLALRFSEVGFKVLGFDIDKNKVSKIHDGQSYIEHISSDSVRKAVSAGFSATSEFQRISEVDAIILCVPTPLNKYREPDLSFVLDTTDSIVPYLKKGQLVSLESTTYPGTTDEELKPRVESKGLKVGEDIFLVFSPEREDPGNPNFSTRTIPKVVGGHTENCLKAGLELYSAVIDRVVAVSSTKAAEMTKLLENIHRAVNIGLVNEMKIVADKMGIDIHEVIDAAATKPFGFVAYRPGPGIGGHCIPIDPFYLTWKAREYGIHTRFIELAGEINTTMPNYVMKKIAVALNEREKSVKGSKVLVLGISYKKNIDDMRESPSVFLMEKLRDDGAKLDYCDPHVPVFPKMREHKFDLKSVSLSPEIIKSYDCVVLTTDHDKFDYDMILKNAKLLVDTRGKFRQSVPNLVKA
ncbi:nucleotide sugar dehydrogenase [Bdellovibrio sp. BCCA]|uniref:nucleotide sugar dehydrogenase n=1 Tax=Bdellovibrio sp. BCCA TaxID=3136281 RepID=UPI0030F0E484